MRVHVAAIVSALLFSSLFTAQAAPGECVHVGIQDFVGLHEDWIIFRGTPSSFAEVNDPQGRLRFKYTVDVERVWKGSVGRRIEIYVSLSGNSPQFEIGHPSLVIAGALTDAVKRRLGVTGTDAYAPAACSGGYKESEITTVYGPGRALPSGAPQTSSAADCVRDSRVPLRKVRDRKPEVSDLREIHTHSGVLIFEIRIEPAGGVMDVRLAKPVDQEAPWPTLADRWRNAISDWRYAPPILGDKPVSVCLTVTVRQEVM